MENLPEIVGLIAFLLFGRLFLRTFKTKPDHWQLKCTGYLCLSVLAFVVLVLGVGLS
ncbi:hypothetical protein [Terasakiella pusilla]|jgi:hypothetical protein|uniref:hypothetical protein n=1 Tax=Terasakiella pusilla TaxID=64973 RepID=UPI003AA9AB0C